MAMATDGTAHAHSHTFLSICLCVVCASEGCTCLPAVVATAEAVYADAVPGAVVHAVVVAHPLAVGTARAVDAYAPRLAAAAIASLKEATPAAATLTAHARCAYMGLTARLHV